MDPQRSDEHEPSFLQTMKWAAVMMLGTLILAAITIPLLRLFG